jgi:hypothetical protein
MNKFEMNKFEMNKFEMNWLESNRVDNYVVLYFPCSSLTLNIPVRPRSLLSSLYSTVRRRRKRYIKKRDKLHYTGMIDIFRFWIQQKLPVPQEGRGLV